MSSSPEKGAVWACSSGFHELLACLCTINYEDILVKNKLLQKVALPSDADPIKKADLTLRKLRKNREADLQRFLTLVGQTSPEMAEILIRLRNASNPPTLPPTDSPTGTADAQPSAADVAPSAPADLTENLAAAVAENKLAAQEIKRIQDELRVRESEVELKNQQVSIAQSTASRMVEQAATVIEQNRVLDGSNKNLNAEVASLQTKLKSADTAHAALASKLMLVEGTLNNCQTTKDCLTEELASTKDELQEAEETNEDLSTKLQASEEQVYHYEEALNEAKAGIATLQGNLQMSQKTINDISLKLKTKTEGLIVCEKSRKALTEGLKISNERLLKSDALNKQLEQQVAIHQEELRRERWQLPPGWKKSVQLSAVDARLTPEMEAEILRLTGDALKHVQAVDTHESLVDIAHYISERCDASFGPNWHAAAGRQQLFGWSVWGSHEFYVCLHVKIGAIDRTLQIVLFKARPCLGWYPDGWKDTLQVVITRSYLPAAGDREAKALALEALRSQNDLKSIDDLEAVAKRIKCAFDARYGVYWQAVVGHLDTFNCCLQPLDVCYVCMEVRSTHINSGVKIVVFKAA